MYSSHLAIDQGWTKLVLEAHCEFCSHPKPSEQSVTAFNSENIALPSRVTAAKGMGYRHEPLRMECSM